MLYNGTAQHDGIHQGRMILLGIGLAYLTLWILEYFSFPTMLVPGFLLDRSLIVLGRLVGMVGQLLFLSTFWLLTWAGFGWARYVLALYLLLSGMFNVILSIMIGGSGGAVLVLGAMSLASAAALMALSVERYANDRLAKGLPALDIAVGILGVTALLIGVAGIQLLQTWQLVEANRAETAFAREVFSKLIPTLDAQALEPVASNRLRQDISEADLAGQFAAIQKELGDFQDWPGLRAASVEALVMNPRPTQGLVAYNTMVHYQKANLLLELDINTATQPWVVEDVYAEKLPKQIPAR